MVKCSHLKTKDASREGACPPWCLFALGGSRAFQDLSCYNREICQAKEEIIAMLKKKKISYYSIENCHAFQGFCNAATERIVSLTKEEVAHIFRNCHDTIEENCHVGKRGLPCYSKKVVMVQ